jgi:hypothetical protein
MATDKTSFVVVVLPEVIACATGNDVTGSMLCACPAFPPAFFFLLYKGSTSTRAIGSDRRSSYVTPSGFPWVCACTSGSCEISSLVGTFDRKWRYETSPRSDQRSRDPFRVHLGARMRNRKLHNIRPSGAFHRKYPLGCSLGRSRLSFSNPGYLPLPRHFIFVYFNNGFHLRCFRSKYLYCDLYILMNYLFNPYMSKEPIFVIFLEIY